MIWLKNCFLVQVSKIEPEGELYEPEVNTLPKFVIEQLEDIERELEEGNAKKNENYWLNQQINQLIH